MSVTEGASDAVLLCPLQDLVMTKSVRKRFRLDEAHAKALAPLARSVEGGTILPQLDKVAADKEKTPFSFGY